MSARLAISKHFFVPKIKKKRVLLKTSKTRLNIKPAVYYKSVVGAGIFSSFSCANRSVSLPRVLPADPLVKA